MAYTPLIFGCTASSALNYKSSATYDDGTCVFEGFKYGYWEDHGTCPPQLWDGQTFNWFRHIDGSNEGTSQTQILESGPDQTYFEHTIKNMRSGDNQFHPALCTTYDNKPLALARRDACIEDPNRCYNRFLANLNGSYDHYGGGEPLNCTNTDPDATHGYHRCVELMDNQIKSHGVYDCGGFTTFDGIREINGVNVEVDDETSDICSGPYVSEIEASDPDYYNEYIVGVKQWIPVNNNVVGPERLRDYTYSETYPYYTGLGDDNIDEISAEYHFHQVEPGLDIAGYNEWVWAVRECTDPVTPSTPFGTPDQYTTTQAQFPSIEGYNISGPVTGRPPFWSTMIYDGAPNSSFERGEMKPRPAFGYSFECGNVTWACSDTHAFNYQYLYDGTSVSTCMYTASYIESLITAAEGQEYLEKFYQWAGSRDGTSYTVDTLPEDHDLNIMKNLLLENWPEWTYYESGSTDWHFWPLFHFPTDIIDQTSEWYYLQDESPIPLDFDADLNCGAISSESIPGHSCNELAVIMALRMGTQNWWGDGTLSDFTAWTVSSSTNPEKFILGSIDELEAPYEDRGHGASHLRCIYHLPYNWGKLRDTWKIDIAFQDWSGVRNLPSGRDYGGVPDSWPETFAWSDYTIEKMRWTCLDSVAEPYRVFLDCSQTALPFWNANYHWDANNMKSEYTYKTLNYTSQYNLNWANTLLPTSGTGTVNNQTSLADPWGDDESYCVQRYLTALNQQLSFDDAEAFIEGQGYEFPNDQDVGGGAYKGCRNNYLRTLPSSFWNFANRFHNIRNVGFVKMAGLGLRNIEIPYFSSQVGILQEFWDVKRSEYASLSEVPVDSWYNLEFQGNRLTDLPNFLCDTGGSGDDQYDLLDVNPRGPLTMWIAHNHFCGQTSFPGSGPALPYDYSASCMIWGGGYPLGNEYQDLLNPLFFPDLYPIYATAECEQGSNLCFPNPDSECTQFHGDEEGCIGSSAAYSCHWEECDHMYQPTLDVNMECTQESVYNSTGCTNPIGLNYDPMVLFDDGSCVMPVIDGNLLVEWTMQLGPGAQLVSFPFYLINLESFETDTTPLNFAKQFSESAGFPEECIESFIGEGVASNRVGDAYYGSLQDLRPFTKDTLGNEKISRGTGFWIKYDPSDDCGGEGTTATLVGTKFDTRIGPQEIGYDPPPYAGVLIPSIYEMTLYSQNAAGVPQMIERSQCTQYCQCGDVDIDECGYFPYGDFLYDSITEYIVDFWLEQYYQSGTLNTWILNTYGPDDEDQNYDNPYFIPNALSGIFLQYFSLIGEEYFDTLTMSFLAPPTSTGYPFTLNGMDYFVLFPYSDDTSSYQYQDPTFDNVDYLETQLDLIADSGVVDNTYSLVGNDTDNPNYHIFYWSYGNEYINFSAIVSENYDGNGGGTYDSLDGTTYEVFELDETKDYVVPTGDNLDWLLGLYEGTAFESYDDLDDWLMDNFEDLTPVDDNSIVNKLPRVLEEFGGIEVEPLYEIPGPYDSSVAAAPYNFGLIFIYYHLEEIISISNFRDYYFSLNPDIYYGTNNCSAAGGVCPEVGKSFRECAELGCFDSIKKDLISGDSFASFNGTQRGQLVYLGMTGMEWLNVSDGSFGNSSDGACENTEEAGLTGDCFGQHHTFEFLPNNRDDNNYGFVKFY